MKILHWRSVAAGGSMRGGVDLELDIGLQIYEVIVHVGNNGPWVALPARVVLNKDGAIRRKLASGKPDYQRILKWRDRDTTDKFSAAVIRLLLRDYPDALGGDRR
jgi:hypothetical protein